MKINHLLIATVCLIVFTSCNKEIEKVPPNILWIVVEDMSSHFGYQGEDLVTTPHINQLAKQGVVFNNAYVSAPVCSAARSAFITGMYQTSIGAHNHRSSRGVEKIYLPEKLKTIPELFKEAGYYTSNSQEQYDKKGKEDYNFDYDSSQLYDGTDWSNRADGQPFFAQIQLRGGKLRNVPKWQEEVMANLDPSVVVTAEQVNLPPYYPKAPVFLQDWADYLNNVSFTDRAVYAEFYKYQLNPSQLMLRKGDYKLTFNAEIEDEMFEMKLYNIKEDPWEQRDLYNSGEHGVLMMNMSDELMNDYYKKIFKTLPKEAFNSSNY